jgi:PLP dependent protein
MMSVAENLQGIRERIERAAARSRRNAEAITLIAVTKTVAAERINEAIQAGVEIIGESRIQEAMDKRENIRPVSWHMIGHLQTNKVKYAVRIFDMIQSVDSIHLAREINKRCASTDRKMPVLIEINTSGEESKFGCGPEKATELIHAISEMENLQIRGLMTIGLYSDDPDAVRPCFISLRQLAERITEMKIPGVSMDILSMGMSSDFELAIEEGSTMVRIGSAIFGVRN